MADGKPQGSAKGRPGRRRAGEFRAAQRPQAGIAGSRSSLRRAAGRPRQAVHDDAASSGRLGSSRQAARLGSRERLPGAGLTASGRMRRARAPSGSEGTAAARQAAGGRCLRVSGCRELSPKNTYSRRIGSASRSGQAVLIPGAVQKLYLTLLSGYCLAEGTATKSEVLCIPLCLRKS